MQWQGRCSKSNRTWVRSQVPIFLVIIFFQVFQRVSCIAVHHGLSPNHLPDGPRPDLVVQMRRVPYALVNQRTWNCKSQSGLQRNWALKAVNLTPGLGPNPLGYFFFFLFLLFILFNCLINYFYYLN